MYALRRRPLVYLIFEASLHFLENFSVIFLEGIENFEPRLLGLENGPALQQLQPHAVSRDPGDLRKGLVGSFD